MSALLLIFAAQSGAPSAPPSLDRPTDPTLQKAYDSRKSAVGAILKADEKRKSENFAAGFMAKETVRALMRDPASARFGNTWGRDRNGLHVGCGEVNGRNGFGGMTGMTSYLFVVETKQSAIEGAPRFARLWNKYCAGADTAGLKAPPKEFRGLHWNSKPPATLQAVASSDVKLSGAAYVEPVPTPFMGVPVKEAKYAFIRGHFFAGNTTSVGRAAYDTLRDELILAYGAPTSSDDDGPKSAWDWGEHSVKAGLSYDKASNLTSFVLLDMK
jgi:hypothetical protein